MTVTIKPLVWGNPLRDSYEAIEIAADLCKKAEGFRSKPYLCPAGAWTIGYGSTLVESFSNGETGWEPVTPRTLPITEATASHYLRVHLLSLSIPVQRLCPGINTTKRLAAILDFVYNMGENRLKHSTLRKQINAGNWDAVRVELPRWVYGKDPKDGLMKKLPGLIIRRAIEVQLTQGD